jgi:serine/threonine-protein kinase
MAVVFRARDAKHGRDVAIKVLRPEIAPSLGTERFLREIQLEARLQHPHILPLHDSGEAAGLLYYVMPFVRGESLRERLRRDKQLPLDEAYAIAGEVAEALAHAHGQGIVHRDIKPENILLSGGHAVVADFGIARAVSVAGSEQVTDSGIVIGTPQYMSPEQASGRDAIDGRSDLYSLGCVVYEMLVGERRSPARPVRRSSPSRCSSGRRRFASSGTLCPTRSKRQSCGRWRKRRRIGSPPRPSSLRR